MALFRLRVYRLFCVCGWWVLVWGVVVCDLLSCVSVQAVQVVCSIQMRWIHKKVLQLAQNSLVNAEFGLYLCGK